MARVDPGVTTLAPVLRHLRIGRGSQLGHP
jgi:hypothetical protein